MYTSVLLGPMSLTFFLVPWARHWTLQKPLLLNPPFLGSRVAGICCSRPSAALACLGLLHSWAGGTSVQIFVTEFFARIWVRISRAEYCLGADSAHGLSGLGGVDFRQSSSWLFYRRNKKHKWPHHNEWSDSEQKWAIKQEKRPKALIAPCSRGHRPASLS